MAALERWGLVDAVATMDGDLVVHGVRRIYTKINYNTGACERYDAAGWTDLVLPAVVESQLLAELNKVSETATERKARKADKAAADQAELARLTPILQVLVSEGVLEADATKFTLSHLKTLYAKRSDLRPARLGNRSDQVSHLLQTLTGAPQTAPVLEVDAAQAIPAYFRILLELVRTHGLEVLIYFAVLVGCDYIDLPNCGPVTACTILSAAYARSSDTPLILRLEQAALAIMSTWTQTLVTPALANAVLAFKHPLVYHPLKQSFEYANTTDDAKLDASVLGAVPGANELETARDAVLCLKAPVDAKTACPPPTPLEHVQFPGEAIPTRLMCWMVSGSRPCLLPAAAPLDLLRDEMEQHEVDTSGTDADVLARAIRAGITVRKPADQLTAEECRGVLRSREAPVPTGADAASLRECVRCLYQLEDTKDYGPPRLVCPKGTALHTYLHRTGLVALSAQQDPSFAFPKTGWMSPSLAPPITMTVVRKWFIELGEQLSGDYTSRQMRQGWARIKNRTSLTNFGYLGPLAPSLAESDGVHESSALSASSSASAPASTPMPLVDGEDDADDATLLHGWGVVDVPHDNSCLLHCFIQTCPAVVAQANSCPALRTLLSEKIRSDPAVFIVDPDKYAQDLLNPNFWCGEEEITVLSSHFSITVHYLDKYSVLHSAVAADATEAIVLAHVLNNHWLFLRHTDRAPGMQLSGTDQQGIVAATRAWESSYLTRKAKVDDLHMQAVMAAEAGDSGAAVLLSQQAAQLLADGISSLSFLLWMIFYAVSRSLARGICSGASILFLSLISGCAVHVRGRRRR